MAKPRVSFRVDEELKQKLDEVASQRGLIPTDAAREALEFWTDLDSEMLRTVQLLASPECLNIKPAVVLQNFFILQRAKQAAELEVWGPHQRLLMQFQVTSDGRVITGEELFQSLKETFIQREERKKQDQLEANLRNGAPLSAEEKAFLQRRYAQIEAEDTED